MVNFGSVNVLIIVRNLIWYDYFTCFYGRNCFQIYFPNLTLSRRVTRRLWPDIIRYVLCFADVLISIHPYLVSATTIVYIKGINNAE